MKIMHFINMPCCLTPNSSQHSSCASMTAYDLLGEYAEPSDDGSTDAHLHSECRGFSGERSDPQLFLEIVMPGNTAKEIIQFRGKHPVTVQPKIHNGYDLIGPRRK